MKTLSRLLMLAALATAFALPAFAQDPAASPAALCDEAAKGELYTQYYNLKKTNQATDQAKAFEIAKQYISKYGTCTDQYTASVKNWSSKYEAAVGSVTRRADFFKAYNANDVAKINSLAQQLLASDQNDAAVALLAAWSNYTNLRKNPGATEADAQNYATKALDLIQGGQEPKDLGDKVSWAPFSSKDEAVSYLNLEIGGLERKSNPDEALKRFVAVAQGSGKAKEEATLYSNIGAVYEGQAAQMSDNYKTITKNYTVETDESKLLLANINRVLDQTIDAYARAVAYSTDAKTKTDLMAHLTELYKSRHNNTDAGLTEFIAGIKAQPLLITEPITSLPAATPTATPEGVSTTTPTGPVVAPPASAPAGAAAKPATTTTTQTKPQPAMPAASSAPAKKRP